MSVHLEISAPSRVAPSSALDITLALDPGNHDIDGDLRIRLVPEPPGVPPMADLVIPVRYAGPEIRSLRVVVTAPAAPGAYRVGYYPRGSAAPEAEDELLVQAPASAPETSTAPTRDAEPPAETGLLYFNGIQGRTGRPLIEALSLEEALQLARPSPGDEVLARKRGLLRKPKHHLDLEHGVDPLLLAQAGWGVLFAEGTSPEIQKALEPLVAHREKALSSAKKRFKRFEHKGGKTAREWIESYPMFGDLSHVQPDKVPYYLLIVGGPDMIPFEFQYALGLEHAVGRLSFDTPAEYEAYARSVVDYETRSDVPASRDIVYWAPRNTGDRATFASADHLVAPLCSGVPEAPGREARPSIASVHGYGQSCFTGKTATKANLAGVLHGRGGHRPAMLFTASHGLGWDRKDALHLPAQGALLGQEWPGFGEAKPQHFLQAADVADDARLHGLVAFLFACFGAGTPVRDELVQDRSAPAPVIADRAFVSALPRRLLAHPNGGALAVIGHVERATSYSIRRAPGAEPQIGAFRSCVSRILAGEPVGHARRGFADRYSHLSSLLLAELDTTKPGPKLDDEELVQAWVERNDAQGYVTLGDPAVRLRVEKLKAPRT